MPGGSWTPTTEPHLCEDDHILGLGRIVRPRSAGLGWRVSCGVVAGGGQERGQEHVGAGVGVCGRPGADGGGLEAVPVGEVLGGQVELGGHE